MCTLCFLLRNLQLFSHISLVRHILEFEFKYLLNNSSLHFTSIITTPLYLAVKSASR